jgi:hypothetical protein
MSRIRRHALQPDGDAKIVATPIERFLEALHTLAHEQLGQSRAPMQERDALPELSTEGSMKVQTDVKAGGLLDLCLDIDIDLSLSLFGCGGCYRKPRRKGC